MSYDITIRHDEAYSATTPRRTLDAFLEGVPEVDAAGPGYLCGDANGPVHFEIDLEMVTPVGDLVEDAPSDEVNCVRIHIPYAFLDASADTAIDVALGLAEHLGWEALDEQTGEPPARGAAPAPPRAPAEPEWIGPWGLTRRQIRAIIIGWLIAIGVVLLLKFLTDLFDER
jgi:hypothetical protein